MEDKYAVSSLAVSGFVALWGTAGVISVRIIIITSSKLFSVV